MTHPKSKVIRKSLAPRPRSDVVATFFYVVETEVQLSACLAGRRLSSTVFVRSRSKGEVMKKLMFAGTFVSVIAAPAFAQSYTPEVGSGNVVPSPYIARTGQPAFAQFGDGSVGVVHVPSPHRAMQRHRKSKQGGGW